MSVTSVRSYRGYIYSYNHKRISNDAVFGRFKISGATRETTHIQIYYTRYNYTDADHLNNVSFSSQLSHSSYTYIFFSNTPNHFLVYTTRPPVSSPIISIHSVFGRSRFPVFPSTLVLSIFLTRRYFSFRHVLCPKFPLPIRIYPSPHTRLDILVCSYFLFYFLVLIGRSTPVPQTTSLASRQLYKTLLFHFVRLSRLISPIRFLAISPTRLKISGLRANNVYRYYGVKPFPIPRMHGPPLRLRHRILVLDFVVNMCACTRNVYAYLIVVAQYFPARHGFRYLQRVRNERLAVNSLGLQNAVNFGRIFTKRKHDFSCSVLKVHGLTYKSVRVPLFLN